MIYDYTVFLGQKIEFEPRRKGGTGSVGWWRRERRRYGGGRSGAGEGTADQEI